MKTGDIIEFTSSEIPLPVIQAAVIVADHPDYIEIMSTLLVPFKRSGKFKRDAINILGVVCEAKDAIARETGFDAGEKVTCDIGSGVVIAGFDGILVARTEDGQLITGGSSFFSRS